MRKYIVTILIVWSFIFLLVPNISKASDSYDSARNSWKSLSKNLLSPRFKNTTSVKIRLNRVDIAKRFLIEADNYLVDFLREKLNKIKISSLNEEEKTKIDKLLSGKITELNEIKLEVEASKDKISLKNNAEKLLKLISDTTESLNSIKNSSVSTTLNELSLAMLTNTKTAQIEIDKLNDEKKVKKYTGELLNIKEQINEAQTENKKQNFVKSKELLKNSQKSLNELALKFKEEEKSSNEK